MNAASIQIFQHAIQAVHGAGSRFKWKEYVCEIFEGQRLWDGDVLLFELDGHPSASECFAWEVDGEVTAVLAEGPVQKVVRVPPRPSQKPPAKPIDRVRGGVLHVESRTASTAGVDGAPYIEGGGMCPVAELLRNPCAAADQNAGRQSGRIASVPLGVNR